MHSIYNQPHNPVAAVTAVQLTVAEDEVTAEEDNPDGATQGTNVVNCADAAVPVPEVQVAVTLQSYKLPEVNPVKLVVVAV